MIPVVPGESISEEEYERWVQPAVAITQLEGRAHSNYVKKELWTRLRSGELLSVAERARWQIENGGFDERLFERLDPLLWRVNDEPDSYDGIWTFGTRNFCARDRVNGPLLATECFGIRFDPVGIAKLLKAMGAVPAEASLLHTMTAKIDAITEPDDSLPKNRPPMSDDALADWAELFIKHNPRASLAAARKAVDAMFPEKYVTRGRLRRILPAQPVGKPKKNDDN